jgi:hypothetical protein
LNASKSVVHSSLRTHISAPTAFPNTPQINPLSSQTTPTRSIVIPKKPISNTITPATPISSSFPRVQPLQSKENVSNSTPRFPGVKMPPSSLGTKKDFQSPAPTSRTTTNASKVRPIAPLDD